MEDFEIVLDVLAGRRESFSELVRRHEAKVRSYCSMMLNDPIEAEDAAQEVFIKAYKALPSFKGNAQFSTWLYRIAANHCMDLLRKRKRQKTQSWDELVEKAGEKMEAALATPSSPPDPLESAELLHQLLEQLPEKSREIMILREIQGLSYQDIADTLGCSLDAVKSRLKRTRKELAIKLRHLFGPRSV